MSVDTEARLYRQSAQVQKIYDTKVTRRQALGGAIAFFGWIGGTAVSGILDKRYQDNLDNQVQRLLPGPTQAEIDEAEQIREAFRDGVEQQVSQQITLDPDSNVQLNFTKENAAQVFEAQKTTISAKTIQQDQVAFKARMDLQTPYGFSTQMSRLKTGRELSLAEIPISIVIGLYRVFKKPKMNREEIIFNPKPNPVVTYITKLRTGPIATRLSSTIDRAKLIFTSPKK
ncbi:hypothetical protein HYT02_04135 [Candidatus Gottesmanbacteria bacterium]|nr:hypothetical protein [Candidatus Gottesmanbacteria bacterium]